MPVALAASTTSEHEEPILKSWTRAERAILLRAKAADLEGYELIHGALIKKVSKNRRHVILGSMLMRWAVETFGYMKVNQEAPIDVSAADNPTNEPEPDLIVLARPMWAFKTCNPGPEDILLLAEVSDSTLVFDLRTKAQLYARAGIKDYWVLDITGKRVIVHREPNGDGSFSSILSYGADETIHPLAMPDREFRLSDLFREEL